jgi:hypothetical protein
MTMQEAATVQMQKQTAATAGVGMMLGPLVLSRREAGRQKRQGVMQR